MEQSVRTRAVVKESIGVIYGCWPPFLSRSNSTSLCVTSLFLFIVGMSVLSEIGELSCYASFNCFVASLVALSTQDIALVINLNVTKP
jgi:hypothetical protein